MVIGTIVRPGIRRRGDAWTPGRSAASTGEFARSWAG